MLTKALELPLPGTISDAVLLDQRVLVALDLGLAIFEAKRFLRTLDIPVQSIVTSDDGRVILAVSGQLERAAPLPRVRRIHRLTAPSFVPEDLGIASIDEFSLSFDGQHWPTLHGDNVFLLATNTDKLTITSRYETFLPVRIECIPEGIWLEISSIGAEHFEVLSKPDLRVLRNGDLSCRNINFPPEMIPLSAWSPTLAQPVVAVHARGMPYRQNERGELTLLPIRNVDRLIVPNGVTITPLPSPAEGLVAAGKRALCWCPVSNGLEFILVCLQDTRVIDRFTIKGATKAGARIVGRDLLIWEGNTLRVFHEAESS